MLSGRAAVWPDMPCLVRWLAFNIQADPVRDGAGWRMTPKTNVTLPIVMITHYIVPHGPFEDLRCFYTRVAAGKCNTDGRGMTSAEWRHFKQVRHCSQWAGTNPHGWHWQVRLAVDCNAVGCSCDGGGQCLGLQGLVVCLRLTDCPASCLF